MTKFPLYLSLTVDYMKEINSFMPILSLRIVLSHFYRLIFSSYGCNCDKNDYVWREDSGLLTDKRKLPVKQLKFGDVGACEEGYNTLGKLKCFGIA